MERMSDAKHIEGAREAVEILKARKQAAASSEPLSATKAHGLRLKQPKTRHGRRTIARRQWTC
jgi:hypothetical protein